MNTAPTETTITTRRESRLALAGTALLVILAAWVYRHAFGYMFDMWSKPVFEGVDYAHGYVLPLVSIYVVWFRRRELALAPVRPMPWALAGVAVALILHWMGVRSQFLRVSLFSFLLLVWMSALYLRGWAFSRWLIFPCSYLIFCIPLNFLDRISFRLRILSSVLSAGLLNGIGMAVERTGTGIRTAGGQIAFDVADPCSGIRSLLAITALAAVYACFTQPRLWKQWTLFLASLPIALLANTARIATIAIVARMVGSEEALTFYHDYSGYFVFAIAVGLLVSLGHALNSGIPRRRI